MFLLSSKVACFLLLFSVVFALYFLFFFSPEDSCTSSFPKFVSNNFKQFLLIWLTLEDALQTQVTVFLIILFLDRFYTVQSVLILVFTPYLHHHFSTRKFVFDISDFHGGGFADFMICLNTQSCKRIWLTSLLRFLLIKWVYSSVLDTIFDCVFPFKNSAPNIDLIVVLCSLRHRVRKINWLIIISWACNITNRFISLNKMTDTSRPKYCVVSLWFFLQDFLKWVTFKCHRVLQINPFILRFRYRYNGIMISFRLAFCFWNNWYWASVAYR